MSQDPIHEPLEGLCRIFEAKRHPQKFEQAERRYNSRLGDIFFSHWYLMEPLHKIYHRKNSGSGKACSEILDMW